MRPLVLNFGDCDSTRGQGSRSDRALPGLSLRLGRIAYHRQTGALRADLPLKRLSANAMPPKPAALHVFCENGASAAKHVVARPRVCGINP